MTTNLIRRQVAGIDLSIVKAEQPNVRTRTLFCMHGIGGNDNSFLPQLQGLSKEHHVFAWNMPGYGQSTRLENLSFEGLSLNLMQVLEQLAIEQPILVGHSIGGMIAQEFAHQFPGRAQSLVLIATTSAFGGSNESFKQEFLKARLKPLEDGISMEAMTATTVPTIVGKNTNPAIIQAAIDSMSRVNPSVYKDVLSCLITFNRRSELHNLTCPVCLIAGEEDTNAPAATMRKMTNKLPDYEYHAIPGAGHLVNLEYGDETNVIITQFIERLGLV